MSAAKMQGSVITAAQRHGHWTSLPPALNHLLTMQRNRSCEPAALNERTGIVSVDQGGKDQRPKIWLTREEIADLFYCDTAGARR
jgi:hypothetical protein